MSEDSSGEAELEVEPETSDPEDVRELHPGELLYKASKARNLPLMAEALAHGADINAANHDDEGKTALIQAVIGVSHSTKRSHEPELGTFTNKYTFMRISDVHKYCILFYIVFLHYIEVQLSLFFQCN